MTSFIPSGLWYLLYSISNILLAQIFVRINSKGVVLSQADFAMSKISVNEEYNGNDIRKAIDYLHENSHKTLS